MCTLLTHSLTHCLSYAHYSPACTGDIPQWYTNPMLWCKASAVTAVCASQASQAGQVSYQTAVNTTDGDCGDCNTSATAATAAEGTMSSSNDRDSSRCQTNQQTKHQQQSLPWQELKLGRDSLWGRSCMEFDVIGALGVCVPADAAAGDFILFTGCGAYETTMQYDFGDGKARNMWTGYNE